MLKALVAGLYDPLNPIGSAQQARCRTHVSVQQQLAHAAFVLFDQVALHAPFGTATKQVEGRAAQGLALGQQLQRIDNPLEALAPVPFIANAIREATKDAGLSSVPNADSIRVVSFLSWRYRDPAHYIAEELGITTRETVASSMGGNSTQSLINATALEIQSGDFDVVILCGGETSRTRKRARAAEIELPWPVVPEDVKPNRIMGEELVMNHEYELSRRIVAPIQIYPIFESAIRAASGRSVDEHNQHLGKLWSNFSKVAEATTIAIA